MGSIVLAGATSGSTTITPASTGTYTITLPAETGTIQTSGAGFTTNGVAYASSTSALTTGSALVFDGTNLGIGTSTPSSYSSQLVINAGSANAAINIQTNSFAGTYSSALNFGTGGQGAGNQVPYYTQAQIKAVGTNDYSAALVFSSQGSGTSNPLIERARIDSSGNLLVGTTSASVSGTGQFYATSNVNGWYSGTFINNNTTGPYGILVQMASASGPNYLAIFRYANVNQCLMQYNGNIVNTNGVYGSISDVKLKENIVDATPKLADLMQVKVRSYNLKSDPTHKQLGVVAQELEQVFPSMVEESKDKDEENNDLGTTTKTVKYSVFVPMLIKAMQEQQVLITAQQSTIQSLTERITALEGART